VIYWIKKIPYLTVTFGGIFTGLDRPLKKESDFERFKGELVEVKVFKPIEGKKIFEGELVDTRTTRLL